MLRKLELSLKGFSDYASWERGVSNYWGNVLFNRALRSKSFAASSIVPSRTCARI